MAGAGALGWIGAIAGWAAPLAIGTFVVVGGRRRRSYDPWRDTMTKLGDGTDGVATAFVAVNLAVAALLGVLAGAVQHTLHVWILTIALIIAAIGSFVFGLTACRFRCRYPLCGGVAPPWLHGLHLVVAAEVGAGIVLAPFLTWFALQDRDDDFTVLRSVSLALGSAAVVLAGVFAQQTLARKRADPPKRADRSERADRPARASSAVPGLAERLLWIVGYGWVVALACTLVRPGWPSTVAVGLWIAVALWFVLRPGWRDPSPEFSLAECQPSTLTPLSRATFGVFRLCTVREADAFRNELQGALGRLIVGTTEDAASALTVGVTASGLRELGVTYRWHARFVEDAFAEGMLKRAPALGDVGLSDPEHWDAGWRDAGRLHVAFWMQATTQPLLEALDDEVMSHFTSVTERLSVPTNRLSGEGTKSREHFGFVDGTSQPWIAEAPSGNDLDRRGGGKRLRRKWKPLALGEFVVGQVDETGDIFPVPSPPEVFLGGTFLVVRKLQQDVAGFRQFAGAGGESKSLAASLVGRASDGVPLEPQTNGKGGNDFTYGNDPEGQYCPLGAHIRRANPRDALGFDSTLSARRRIVRRGMPYGAAWEDGDPEEDRGLLFLACNVRIAEQFEFIQKQWLNDGSPFGLGNIPDPIGGLWDPRSRRSLVVAGRPPEVLADLPSSLVTTKGGEYLFVPSIPGLHALAGFRPGPRRSA